MSLLVFQRRKRSDVQSRYVAEADCCLRVICNLLWRWRDRHDAQRTVGGVRQSTARPVGLKLNESEFRVSCFYQSFVVYSGGKHLNNWCQYISEENIFSLCTRTLILTPARLLSIGCTFSSALPSSSGFLRGLLVKKLTVDCFYCFCTYMRGEKSLFGCTQIILFSLTSDDGITSTFILRDHKPDSNIPLPKYYVSHSLRRYNTLHPVSLASLVYF